MTIRLRYLFLAASLLLASCGAARVGHGSDVAYVDPVFSTFVRVGIVSEMGTSLENVFIPLYASSFPNQEVFERRYLAKLIGEQDLLPGRLDEATRAQLGELAGLQAIIVPYQDSDSFSLRIIDVASGRILGSVNVVSVPPYRLGEPKDYRLRQGVSLLKMAANGEPIG